MAITVLEMQGVLGVSESAITRMIKHAQFVSRSLQPKLWRFPNTSVAAYKRWPLSAFANTTVARGIF